MDGLFESPGAYQPRGWQASVLAEQGRRRPWPGNRAWHAWMTSSDAMPVLLGVVGLALLVLAPVMCMVRVMSLRNSKMPGAPAKDSSAKQVTVATLTGTAPASGESSPRPPATGTANGAREDDVTAQTSETPGMSSIRALPSTVSEDCDESDEPSTSKAVMAVRTRTRSPNEGTEDIDIQERVRGARQTLSSIHAGLPEGLAPSEKVAMTHMMLEAIKVNESCKATSSMQRMEHIAEHGNEIQSELRTIKEEKHRSEDVARRSLALRRAVLDGISVGVVSMVCTVAAVVWYAGSDTTLRYGLLGFVKLRTTRTLAAATCSRDALSSTLPVGLGLPRVLPVFAPVVQLWCYAWHALRLVQAAVLVVLTPILISKLGIFRLGEVPVFKLLVSFGLVCGASGWYAVDWLGGRARLWLVLWEGLVMLAIAVVVSAPRLAQAGLGRSDVQWLPVGTVLFGFLLGLAPFVARNT